MATYYVAKTGNDTTGDGSSGNPYATPGKAAGVATTAGDIIYVKSGTYTTTSTTSNVAGGRVVLSNGVVMQGYQTTVTDLGTRPVLKAHTGSFTLITYSGNSSNSAVVVNVEADANGQSSIVCFEDTSDYGAGIYRCVARSGATGFKSVAHAAMCSSYSCTTGFAISGGALLAHGSAVGCFAKGGTTGFYLDPRTSVSGSVASGCGIGFNLQYGNHLEGCVAWGCSGDGFNIDTYGALSDVINCVAVGNGGYGFDLSTQASMMFLNNASYNNTSGRIRTTPRYEVGGVTLSGDPFTNAASDDFTLNSTAGAGAALKGVGLPETFPMA